MSSKKSIIRFTLVGANMVSIVFALIWLNYLFSTVRLLFSNINLTLSKKNSFENLVCKNRNIYQANIQ